MNRLPFSPRRMFVVFSGWLPLVMAFLLAHPVLGQGPQEAPWSKQLAELAARMERLEAENHTLRDRLARLEGTDAASNGAPAVRPVALASPPPQAAPAAQPAAEATPPKVQWGAEIRFRPESRSDFNQKNALNNFLLQRIRLDARLRLSEQVAGLVQFQDSRFWGQETSTASNESNVDLHQAYLQVDRFLHDRLRLRLGRQELIYGNERLIGAFGWDNVGRSFDALKLTYTAPVWSYDFLFSRVADRRNSARGNDSQDLIGLYARIGKSEARFGLEPYVLYLRDGLETRGERPGSGPESTRLVTLGFRHFANFTNGFGYTLENAYQLGQSGPDTHRAAALAAVGRYRFARRFSPEIGFEYDVATGDSDPQDGRSGEFHNLFPTNHMHYGYADYMGWRNMQNFKPYFAFQPAANVRAELSYHRLLLMERRGAWKNAGGKVLGFDPTGRLGTDLGHEIDLTLSFPMYERVRMLAGYSVFVPGKFARASQGPQASQFGYLQTLVTF